MTRLEAIAAQLGWPLAEERPLVNPPWHARSARIEALPGLCAGLAAALAVLALTGRALGAPLLAAVVPGQVAMKPNTAVALILAAATLWLATRAARSRGRDLLALTGAVAVGLLGLLTLAEYALGVELGIGFPGRISAITAASLLFAAFALGLTQLRHAPAAAQGLALAWCALHLVALLGHLYGVQDAYGFGRYTLTAPATSIAFLALGFGMLAARPSCGVTKLVLSDTAGGASARRLLPAFLVLPVVIGWLRVQGERAGLFGAALGITLVAVVYVVTLSTLTLWSAHSLRTADLARRAAHDALRDNEERFRRLLQNAPDVIYRYRLGPDRGIDYVSPAVAEVVGYTPEECRADPLLVDKLVHPEDRPLLGAALRGELPAGAPYVARWIHRDGRVIWTEHRIVTLRDACGHPVAVEGISRDITERVQAEQESRLRTRALEATANAVVITDTLGSMLWVNPAFTTLTGYTAAEVLGRNTRVLKSGAQDPAFYARLWQTIQAGDVWSGEVVNRRKNGSLYTEEMTITPVRSEAGAISHFVAIKQDVSERRRAEAARAESEARFREIAENIQEVFWITDRQQERMVYISPAYEQIWGRSCKSLYEDPVSFVEAIHPDDRERVVASFADYRRGRMDEVYRIVRPDGSLRWIHAHGFTLPGPDGAIARMAGNARDITELKLAEEQLRLQKETLQTVVDNIPIAVNFIDASGRLLFANREWERLLGWTAAEAQGTDILAACYPDPAERQAARHFMKTAAGAWGDFRTRTKDGRSVETAWANVRLSDGTVLGVGQDMSERKRLEAEYRQAQKMEAIGRLAGGVAHDFNNLLGVITGYGEFLRRRLAAEPELHRYADQVLKAAERAAGLTRQLLAFSRKQVLQPRILDLNAVVGETEKMLRRLIGEDIQLVTTLDERLGPVLADPGQLEQVLMNLAVNARDAMPRGGRLSIETHNADVDGTFARQRQGIAPGAYAMLVVSDTGEGMTPEVKARIFEPFFTTKEIGKGTGLGLATVHGIVTQSGGHLWVYSEPGHGTTFKIYLPRADAQQHERETAPPAARALPRGNETVLLVEDEQSLLEIVRECLEDAGYTVLQARDGAEALEVCASRREPVDLLLTDVVMPKLGGRELAQRLHDTWPGLKVLYMSGYTDDAVVLHGVLAEHMDLLQKPFTVDLLARKIREVLDRPTAA